MDEYYNATSVCRMIKAGKILGLKSSGRNDMIKFIKKNRTSFDFGEIEMRYNRLGGPGYWIKQTAIDKLRVLLETYANRDVI